MPYLEEEVHQLREQVAQLSQEIRTLRELWTRSKTQWFNVGEDGLPPAWDALEQELKKTGDTAVILIAGLSDDDNNSVKWWHKATTQVLDYPTSQIVQFCAPFANEHRVTLLKALMDGEKTSAQLAEISSISTGQLYHHLKALLAARYVHQKERNHYVTTSVGKEALLTVAALANPERLRTVYAPDEKVTFRHGDSLITGSHAELYATNPAYREYYDRRERGEEERTETLREVEQQADRSDQSGDDI